jgi:biopolymer transport protein ExbD
VQSAGLPTSTPHRLSPQETCEGRRVSPGRLGESEAVARRTSRLSERTSPPEPASRGEQSKRFSQLPAFALIAAPCLAVLVAVYTPYFAPREATGLELDLASTCRENGGNNRLIVLHITDAGKLFLNTEQEDWNGLSGRLSEIYSVRAHRTPYFLVDRSVPFQTVADALDTVENAPVTVGPQAAGMEIDKLDITVRLLTPSALNTRCLQPVETGASQHASR